MGRLGDRVRDNLQRRRNEVHIAEQGFPGGFPLMARRGCGGMPPGVLSELEREQYQWEKAERGPAERPGLEEWL